MKFRGFHHIGLAAKDAEKSLKFYTEGLGGKVTFSFQLGNTGKTAFLVDLGGDAVVEILPFGIANAETDPRWLHIALDTDDARTAYQMALNAGALSKTEPKNVMLGKMSVCNAFVFGPDGESIEFFQVI